jgi:hypothetical protein
LRCEENKKNKNESHQKNLPNKINPCDKPLFDTIIQQLNKHGDFYSLNIPISKNYISPLKR